MQTWGRYTVFSCIERTYLVEVYDAYLPIAADLVRRVHIRKPSEAPEAPRALVQHARQAVQLRHSRIASILELSYAGDVPLVVSEGLPGRSLATLMGPRPSGQLGLDVHAALFAAIETLEALSHTHQHTDPLGHLLGMVHRDVRPDSIWVGFDGEVRLGGFGYAVTHTMPREPLPPLLHPLYWSPELAAGRTVDHRSDIFSVGAILVELLTGRTVYDGRTAEESWSAARQGQVNLLSRLAPHLSADLLRTIDAALSPDPGERPPSAGVFRDELARLLYRSEPAYGASRLASSVAMSLGEAADDDRARAMAAYQHLSHLEPGLVIKPPAPPSAPAAPATTEGVSFDRRRPPPPPEITEDLLPSSDAWGNTDRFPQLDPEGSDAFAPFEERRRTSSEAPSIDDLELAAPLQPKPAVESTTSRPSPVVDPSPSKQPPFTPPRIEAPDPAAAMADAFSAELSEAQPAPARRRPGVGRRGAIAVGLIVAIGAAVWLASSASFRRRFAKNVRIAIVGRKPGGTLTVQSIPSGAEVVLDGEQTGRTTPLTIENLESELVHHLELRLAELVQTTTVTIKAHSRRTLRLEFPDAIARLHLKTEPEGAEIMVDGRAFALSPADLPLRVGRKTIVQVTKPGYIPKSWTFDPKPGEALKLEHTLEKTEALKAADAEQAEALRAAGVDASPAPDDEPPPRRKRRRRARRQQ